RALWIGGLIKSYGMHRAVDDVSFEVPTGSLMTLLGPSGCGKTTILRAIAGFVAPDAGRIEVGGVDITGLPPERRQTAMLFQNYALFPHMTVTQNVAFGLRMRRLPRDEIASRVEAALALVRLEAFAARYPAELSGGQQQRAALARALVIEPQLLLLDEPFGALDQNLREAMQVELRKLQQRLGITTILVTHDQQEALILSDLIAVMNAGKIEQLAPPIEVYDHPATRFVAGFMGAANLLTGTLVARDATGFTVGIGAGTLRLPGAPPAGDDGEIALAVRPEAIGLDAATGADNDDTDGFVGAVSFRTNLGSRLLYEIELIGGLKLNVEEQRQDKTRVRALGERVRLRLDPHHCTVLRG
ncbi:MAG TPA: ABC transporter ATP-binding protein, partial [Candidatus Sulfotelmatobacter sp.]|nr:ABC transporter ATP-binding protein [Candidatus Sulfotelmatobacter sp.]